MPAMDFAILWKFQLQYCGILICNFRYFYLTTNKKRLSYDYEIGIYKDEGYL